MSYIDQEDEVKMRETSHGNKEVFCCGAQQAYIGFWLCPSRKGVLKPIVLDALNHENKLES